MIFNQGPTLCVGADPHAEVLKSWGLENNTQGLTEFCEVFVDSLPKDLSVVKPQVSLFEAFGGKGMLILEQFLVQLQQAQKYVIADAKRSDIGSSMDGYAQAWLSGDAFRADAVTVNPYLGIGSLESMHKQAEMKEKHVFTLIATSNPEAKGIQSHGLSKRVLEDLIALNSPAAGVVVGATVDLDLYQIRKLLVDSELPILAPGFGAQGVSLEAAGNLFTGLERQLITNVSRSVLMGERAGFTKRIEQALGELS